MFFCKAGNEEQILKNKHHRNDFTKKHWIIPKAFLKIRKIVQLLQLLFILLKY